MWLFILILVAMVGLVFAIIGIVRYVSKKKKEESKHLLQYSDKVKNYHGKNNDNGLAKLTPKYYDENGKRKMSCDDSEQFFSGNKNYLLESDKHFVKEFVEYVFDDSCCSDDFVNKKTNRIYNSKENKSDTLLDIRHFFKNSKHVILPFHITLDIRSQMILYYCKTRAEKCIMMPRTKYSSKSTDNYLAYFPLDCFDEILRNFLYSIQNNKVMILNCYPLKI